MAAAVSLTKLLTARSLALSTITPFLPQNPIAALWLLDLQFPSALGKGETAPGARATSSCRPGRTCQLTATARD